MASWAEDAVPVTPRYGAMQNPLLSSAEPCPECDGELVGRHVPLAEDFLAAFACTPTERAHYQSIRRLTCATCGWSGVGYR